MAVTALAEIAVVGVQGAAVEAVLVSGYSKPTSHQKSPLHEKCRQNNRKASGLVIQAKVILWFLVRQFLNREFLR